MVLKEGGLFLVASPSGEVDGGSGSGLPARDTGYLSEHRVGLDDGEGLVNLASRSIGPWGQRVFMANRGGRHGETGTIRHAHVEPHRARGPIDPRVAGAASRDEPPRGRRPR